jgi:bilirubin oxidase
MAREPREQIDPARRRLVLAGLAGAAAGCGGGGDAPMDGFGPDSGPASFVPAGQAWRDLPALPNQSGATAQFAAAVRAAGAVAALVPGVGTQVLAYNGSSPGPLIEAFEGDRVRVAFENRLGEASTVHWHGLPVPAVQDGNPMDPVLPGATRVYEFELPAGSAGSYWYHPHAHATTHEQVFRGLAGAFVVRSRSDPLAALPERVVFITDLRLDARGQIAPNTVMDFRNGREGEQLLVNGVRQPVATAAPGRTERWRLYNATNARYLLLAVDGAAPLLVAQDGRPLAAPRAVTSVLLAPAQRADLVVRVSPAPGERLRLRTLPYGRGMGMHTPGGETLLEVAAGSGAAQPPAALPASLPAPRSIEAPQRAQTLVLDDMGMHSGHGMFGMAGAFTISGRTFDPARDDFLMRAGAAEEWTVRNEGMMDHPLHIHGCSFQLVASNRGDIAADPRLGAFMDTVNLRPGEAIRLRLRIDSPGRRMVHCHILEHEDLGMMAVANVLA